MLERNCFGNTRKSKLPLPSLPTESRANTVIGVFKFWSQSNAKNATRSAASAAARRKAAILAIADAHARLGVGWIHAIDDHLGAAVIDVVKLREDGQLRRREPHFDGPRLCRGRLAQPEQDGPHRSHADLGLAGFEIGKHAFARGDGEVDVVPDDRSPASFSP